MPALIVSRSILGITIGRTFLAVPYSCLKRDVYYFVRRIFSSNNEKTLPVSNCPCVSDHNLIVR